MALIESARFSICIRAARGEAVLAVEIDEEASAAEVAAEVGAEEVADDDMGLGSLSVLMSSTERFPLVASMFAAS